VGLVGGGVIAFGFGFLFCGAWAGLTKVFSADMGYRYGLAWVSLEFVACGRISLEDWCTLWAFGGPHVIMGLNTCSLYRGATY